MKEKNILSIAAHHIEPGIKKYNGKIDAELNTICKAAGLNYTAYLFADQRVLLVLPNEVGGFLYPNKETLFNSLNLE